VRVANDQVQAMDFRSLKAPATPPAAVTCVSRNSDPKNRDL